MEKPRQEFLSEMLKIIKEKPGIRPSELNRILGKPHTASSRNTLIKRGLIKKERKGTAVHYYPAN